MVAAIVIPLVSAYRAKLVIITTVSPPVAANVVVARVLLQVQRLSPVACTVWHVPLILTALPMRTITIFLVEVHIVVGTLMIVAAIVIPMVNACRARLIRTLLGHLVAKHAHVQMEFAKHLLQDQHRSMIARPVVVVHTVAPVVVLPVVVVIVHPVVVVVMAHQ